MTDSLRALLQEIYHRHSRLTPDLVLDEARDPAHPLHNRFEWDDSVAGEKYRRTQARELIRTARITYKDGDEFSAATSVRAYHSVPDGDGFAYRPAEEIAENPMMRELLLRSMERDWKALRRRYGHFEDFTKLVMRDLENGPASD